MLPSDLIVKAETLLAECRKNGLRVATAESCTGGLIAGCLTSVAGSSDVVDRGFVTYDNQAKSDMLDVPEELFEEFGAVSEPVARKMAEGALTHSRADLTVSVTGIAGPGGGTPTKPVGLVHFGCAGRGRETVHASAVFNGDRQSVRLQAVEKALEMMFQAALS